MKKFVELIQRVYTERYQTVIDRILKSKMPVAYLSIRTLSNAIEIVEDLRKQGMNITNLVTTTVPPEDLKVDFNLVQLADFNKIQPRPEYIFTVDRTWDVTNARVAKKTAPDCKIISMVLLYNDHTNIYETFMSHLTDLQGVYESLIDETSRRTFCGYWLGNICNRFDELVYSDMPHYFCEGFIPPKGGVVIEGGSYDGGSATIFAEMGYKVYGFELEKGNYEKIKPIAREKNFVIENLGLGAAKGELKFTPTPNGPGSYINAAGSEVAKITTIDAYVRENALPRVDFIKLDVEGSELNVLRGATVTINRFKPILAISAYHKWDDFWVLMNFIKSVRPDYKFALRQFPENREGIPSMFGAASDDYLYDFGLEIDWRDFYECVLFAR